MGLVKLHWNAKTNSRHDGGLVCGVHAFDVKGRVGFGIAQALRFFQRHAKVQSFVAHFRQDKVGGAVDDARNPFDLVGRQAFTQAFDDGNAACHGGLKHYHHAFVVCCLKNLGAVHGQQRFVGCHHVFARSNRLHHQRLGNAVTADQFDDDVDLWIGNHGACVADYAHFVADDGFGASGVQISHHGDLNTPASAAGNFIVVAL